MLVKQHPHWSSKNALPNKYAYKTHKWTLWNVQIRVQKLQAKLKFAANNNHTDLKQLPLIICLLIWVQLVYKQFGMHMHINPKLTATYRILRPKIKALQADPIYLFLFTWPMLVLGGFLIQNKSTKKNASVIIPRLFPFETSWSI